MEEISAQRTKEIARQDWKTQIEQLNEIVNEVKNWQSAIFEEFGRPRAVTHIKTNSQEEPSFDSGLGISQQFIITPFFFKESRKERRRRLERERQEANQGFLLDYTDYTASFTGATILQGMEVKQLELTVEIIYKATLKTDENHFLTDMLPIVVKPVDPDYELYDIKITVPRGELVRESLFALDRRLSKPKPKSKHFGLF